MEQWEVAFSHAAANRGAPGPDRQTIDEVRKHVPRRLAELGPALLAGTYRPGDIRRVWIPKSGGGQRGLGTPIVLDRGLRNAYFAERGLESLRERFMAIWVDLCVPVQLTLLWDTERS